MRFLTTGNFTNFICFIGDESLPSSGIRKLFEDSSAKEVAHSDWIWSKIETYGKVFDLELEVKMKDLALLKYIKENKKILS